MSSAHRDILLEQEFSKFQSQDLLILFVVVVIVYIFIEVEWIYNVVLGSGVQQSESVICIHTHIYTHTHTHTRLFFRFFSFIGYYKLLSSLCSTVGPCWLSILYIVVCICLSQPPNLSQ